ncbi:MAG: NADH-quinone oxidoreductase subunit NuoF [Planctomycetes bacterium]|nr:NADH-quinone oxidoreductase subunit NuoF [Planctomycetota bacterium]
MENGHTLEVARKYGAYSRIDKRIFDKSQFELIDQVMQSGIRGRGGAGFPTGMKWSFVPRTMGKPVYLVINADEGEPGTFKDRFLMEKDPHALIEGMIIAGYSLNVRTAYIFVRGEMLPQIENLNNALREAYAAGLLGRNINGSRYSLDIYVHRGAGAYICGEETALIEALEGNKGQPRLKPPFPAVSGAFACPTVVNNVETIAALPWIFEHGPQAYRQWGTDRSPGSKLFSISGDVKKPGVYEVPLAIPMMEFFEVAGGIDGDLAGCIPGGSSAPVLTAEECKEATMDYECMASMKTMLGSGAVMPFNTTRDVVQLTKTLAHFYAHESCGQCTPCREGTGYVDRIVGQLIKGEAHKDDVELIYDLADRYESTTICPLATADAWAVKGFINKFKDKFVAYQDKSEKTSEERDVQTTRPGAFW